MVPYLPALVMIISVVHLWNSDQRSRPWRMTFVPLVATDSAVLANVVTTVPVSGIVTLLPISVCVCVCVEGGRYVGGWIHKHLGH